MSAVQSPDSKPVVVVGASVAGVRTVQALRRLDPAIKIVLVGAEDEHPYDKPSLSKGFLYDGAGQKPLIDAAELLPGVEMRRGVRAEHLDTSSRIVTLSTGERVRYRALVIATGARPRPLPWPDLDAAHVLRDLTSAHRLRIALADAGHVAVLGGGFIGSEVAAAARRLGKQVSIIDAAPVPAARIVGATVGRALAAVHEAHGVRTHFGSSVVSVRSCADGSTLELGDGTIVQADLLVAGIGVVPETGWLASSGLDVSDGVLCDATGRAAGADDVYAVGDVARWDYPVHGRQLRVEHWTNAVEQAGVVAHAIAAPEPAEPFVPSFYVWSDQYDWKIQMVGLPRPDVEPTIIGETGPTSAAPRFVALYPGADSQLAFAVTVNSAWAGLACRKAVGNTDLADVAGRISERFARS